MGGSAYNAVMSDVDSPPVRPVTPAVKPRPRWLRALGHDDPPTRFEAGGFTWQRLAIYKHDAFAATALYARIDDPTRRAVGKFSRRQAAFGVPLGWLGKRFHDREVAVYRRMADQPGVPAQLGEPIVGGRRWPNAAAREYVTGHPLGRDEKPNDDFFPALEKLLETFHARRVAVVDLHKRDNILVGEDGRPHLMDFQISLSGSTGWRAWIDPRAWWLPSAIRADRYHLMKHWIRHRPDQLAAEQRDLNRYRPASVRLWRRLVRPVHVARRKLFVGLGVRTGKGDPDTEVAPDVRPRTRHVATTHQHANDALTSAEPGTNKLPV